MSLKLLTPTSAPSLIHDLLRPFDWAKDRQAQHKKSGITASDFALRATSDNVGGQSPPSLCELRQTKQGPLVGGFNWLLSQYSFGQPRANRITLRCVRRYSMLSYHLIYTSASSAQAQGPLVYGMIWLLSQYGFNQPGTKGITLRLIDANWQAAANY
jgi:hypothetical protein